MKSYLKSLACPAIFLLMQAVCPFIVLLVSLLSSDQTFPEVFSQDNMQSTGILIASMLLSGLMTIVCLRASKLVRFRQTFDVRSVNWVWGAVAVVAAFFGVFGLNILSDLFCIEDLLADQFLSIAQSPWGVLDMALLGPVVEELVFREGVLGGLLRRGATPWKAILFSSLLFGFIHFNPAQVFFAALMAIILSIIYYRTRNVVLVSLIHILNNSVAVLQLRLLGPDAADFHFADFFGGTLITIVVMLTMTVTCVYLLSLWWKRI